MYFILLKTLKNITRLKLRSHKRNLWKHCKHTSLFHCIAHAALKRFNGIVTIKAVNVFLAVIAKMSRISLCVIAG